MRQKGDLIVSGGGRDDECFTINFPEGEINWNVTKIKAACAKGKFGPPLEWDAPFPATDPLAPENTDRAKIDFFKTRPDILAKPVIAIEGLDVGPGIISVLTFVDGNHRIIAMAELGCKTFNFYLVPRAVEHKYRINFFWCKP